MVQNQRDLDILSLVERRLDAKLDSIDKLLNQSLTGLKELYEVRNKFLENRIIELEKKIDTFINEYEDKRESDKTEKREDKKEQVTKTTAVMGWVVAALTAIASALIPKFFN